MSDTLPLLAVSLIAVIIFAIAPIWLKNVIGLGLLLLIDYLRQVAYYYNLFSLSELNYISVAIYGTFILYCVLFRTTTTIKVLRTPFKTLSLFWAMYLGSAIFSIILFGIEPKFAVFTSFKVVAFLCAAANLQSAKEVYLCIIFVIVLGFLDLLAGWTEATQSVVRLGDRELGVIPWLRIDAIWLSQALVAVRIGAIKPIKGEINAAAGIVKAIYNFAIVILMLGLIIYGIISVQLRVLALELLISVLVVIIATKGRSTFKLMAYALIVTLIAFTLLNSLDTNRRQVALQGLLERDDGGRLELWSYSLDLWLQSPIVGHGLGTDGFLVSQLNLPGRQGSHNVYIILLVEFGIIGLVAWLYINFRAVRLEFLASRHEELRERRNVALTLLALHVSMLFHILFHGLIYFPWVILMPAIAFSVFRERLSDERILSMETSRSSANSQDR